MSGPSKTQAELNDLLNQLCNGQLTESEKNRLNELLRLDGDESLEQYTATMDLHAALVWDAVEPSIRTEAGADNSADVPESSPESLPATLPVLGFLADRLKQVGEVVAHPTPLSLLVATLVVASALLTLGLWTVDTLPGEASRAKIPIGHITRVSQPKWNGQSNARPSGTPLFQGDRLELVEGQAEISLNNGVRIALQSPVTFEIDSLCGGSLSLGTLAVLLPGKVDHFTIQAPTLDVIDLGTEFGVKVDPKLSTDVHVFDGSVEVRPKGADGTTTGQTIVLHAGQALRVEVAGKASVIEMKESVIVRVGEIGLPEDHLRWIRYSQNMRQDPSLVAYYTFDRNQNAAGQLVNRAPKTRGRLHGVLGGMLETETDARSSPAWTSGRWRGKGALRFRAKDGQYVMIPDWEKANVQRAMTFAAWIRSGRNSGHMMIAAQWERRPTYFFSLALRDKKKEFQGRGLPLRLRISEEGLPHGNIGITKSEANDATLTTTDQGWIHVAFTIEAGGGQIRLYKNGREIDAGPLVFHPAKFPHSRQPLVLGTYSGNKSTFFDGWMDEIAVFRRALHATEIGQMYEAGKPNVSK